MKKLINTSFIYMIAALVCGVFYREFTKFMDFEGKTSLAVTHVHLFVLGTIMFLLLVSFSIQTNLMEQKRFKAFFILYNIALPLMVIMFIVRGVVQVTAVSLSKGMDAAISGIAGITHILLAVAIFLLFSCLKNMSSNFKK